MKILTSKLFLPFLILLICSVASFSQQSSSSVSLPKGWKKVNAEGFFTFYLPPNVWDTGFSGVDEFYKEYRIGKMRFMFVHMPMSILSYDKRELKLG